VESQYTKSIVTDSHEIAVEYAGTLSSRGHDTVIASLGDSLLVSTFEDYDEFHAVAPILEIFRSVA
jgi:hypothetical protein